ncbi:MAG: pilus assembly protein, partial [Aeromonas sp.]
YTITFASDNARNAYVRSSHNNKLYYNPQLTYRPWANADGSLMANANVTYPMKRAAGCRNLTQTNRAWWSIYYTDFSPYYYNRDESFWPAVYFDYKGSGNVKLANSYTRVEIQSGKTYGDRPNRSDCRNAPVCSYAEEIQNFANWYTYYRSRILAARAGVGRAFASQGGAFGSALPPSMPAAA